MIHMTEQLLIKLSHVLEKVNSGVAHMHVCLLQCTMESANLIFIMLSNHMCSHKFLLKVLFVYLSFSNIVLCMTKHVVMIMLVPKCSKYMHNRKSSLQYYKYTRT
jgi:hypothetical protein